jgi:uncharacterized membrane protein
MTEPWFNPNFYAWIPGTMLGIAGGLLGGLSGWLASRGRARRIVLWLHGLIIIMSAGLLMVGLYALYVGQPYGVWYGLLWPGVIGTILFSLFLPLTLKRYREAEERRLIARDL